MLSFLLGLVLLIGGYFIYGNFIERIINPDDRKTPAYAKQDGVDFITI